jgi:hypothetical protein
VGYREDQRKPREMYFLCMLAAGLQYCNKYVAVSSFIRNFVTEIRLNYVNYQGGGHKFWAPVRRGE